MGINDMERITSRKNPRLVHLKKLGASREYRYETGEYVCDGEKLLREAVMHGAEITCVVTSGERPDFLPDSVPVYSVDGDILRSVSSLKNPQPLLFSCRISQKPVEIVLPVLILERVQDPGNVGTAIRTANAMGVGTVLLTGGCADPVSPKTVRAAMGAVFRQRVYELGFDDIVKLHDGGLRLLGAAAGAGGVSVANADFTDAAVVIGSEGQGLSEKMLSLCDGTVFVPMTPECESLNAGAAAAIIMWEMCGKCLR